MRHNSSLFFCLIASAFVLIGCRQESLEKDGFQLYYSGVTNIGPNLMVELKAHHFGGEPTEFAITGVTYEDSEYSGDGFEMNGEDGTVKVSWAPEIKPGEYYISVSCKVSGAILTFPDIIKVTFFKGVPDSIKVTPDTLLLHIQELAQKDTSAVITTDSDHVSITGYAIANIRYEEEAPDLRDTSLFRISKDGVITVMKSDKYKLGTYNIDVKLNTMSYDSTSTEGLFTDALTVKVVSVPLGLSYTPDSGVLEEETKTKTSFRSVQPVMTGGTMEDVVWKIASCTPANSKLKIDAQTGILYISEDHGLKKGVTYVIDVNVRNRYSTEEGLTVKGAYSLETVEYIAPIGHFGYDPITSKQGLGWSVEPDDKTDSGHIRFYEWTDPEAQYTKQLELDSETGKISAAKGNSLPDGTHEISVTASNGKTGGEVVAVLSLEIKENPYYFSYFSYGNNLGLTEEQSKGVSQFRVGTGYGTYPIVIESADITSDISDLGLLRWKLETITNDLPGISPSKIDLDETTGKLTIKSGAVKVNNIATALITASSIDPDDPENNSYSVTMPVFVQALPESGVIVDYKPFVLRVNPEKGGRSVKPMVSKDNIYFDYSEANIYFDYRRNFFYLNINGTGPDGLALKSGKLADKTSCPYLAELWYEYFGNDNKYGSKDPMSYYNENKRLDDKISYVDGETGEVVVNIENEKVRERGYYGDGIILGTMTYSTEKNNKSISDGSEIRPIAIWLDKDFE